VAGVNGISGCATLWHDFIVDALAGQADTWYPVPGGLTTKVIDGEIDYYLAGTDSSTNALGTASPSPSPSPSPTTSPSPSPSPSPTPPPTPTPTPTPGQGQGP
jgi:hypothetical protein